MLLSTMDESKVEVRTLLTFNAKELTPQIYGILLGKLYQIIPIIPEPELYTLLETKIAPPKRKQSYSNHSFSGANC